MDYLSNSWQYVTSRSKLFYMLFNPVPPPTFTEKELADQSGKVYIVTGSTAGIGFAVAKFLYSKNAKVYISGRTEEKAKKAIDAIKAEYPKSKGQLDSMILELADLNTVKPGVAKFLAQETKLNGIVHNAGVMNTPKGSFTEQGYELQFGVNNLGSQLLQHHLDDLIIKTAEHEPVGSTRIVWVSSSGHLISPRFGYRKDWLEKGAEAGVMTLYGQSKAINIYQGYMWKKHHKDSKVLSASVHPGLLNTELGRYSAMTTRLGKLAGAEAKYGAYSELYVLQSPDVTPDNIVPYYTCWGRPQNPRSDILQGLEEKGEELWGLLEERIEEYL